MTTTAGAWLGCNNEAAFKRLVQEMRWEQAGVKVGRHLTGKATLPPAPDHSPLSQLLFPGNYHSTKIWEFRMTHHCGSLIIITTDPKNAQYCVVEGARQKVSHWVAGVGG